MGKIVVAMYLTLDGVMESPSWTMPYWEDSLAAYQAGAQENAERCCWGASPLSSSPAPGRT